jgi:hypothetical protein
METSKPRKKADLTAVRVNNAIRDKTLDISNTEGKVLLSGALMHKRHRCRFPLFTLQPSAEGQDRCLWFKSFDDDPAIADVLDVSVLQGKGVIQG